MAVRHVILPKRETHVGVGREIARAQDEKMWKDEKNQGKVFFFWTKISYKPICRKFLTIHI